MLHDREIREPLFDFLEESYGKIRILEEKTMGKSRADIVMVTPDALVGIEIKSDADTYARLARQVKDYDRYYDYNIAVVGTTHALHIEEHVPPYWGIITVERIPSEMTTECENPASGEEPEGGKDTDLDFYILRRPQPNPQLVVSNKLRILWRPELFELQMHFGMPKYKEKSKDFVIRKIAERLPGASGGTVSNKEKASATAISKEELDRKISELLFERDYANVEQMLREYRKGELQKLIDAETDTGKIVELMSEQAERRGRLKMKHKKRRRRTGGRSLLS